jgi:hypothetical protein
VVLLPGTTSVPNTGKTPAAAEQPRQTIDLLTLTDPVKDRVQAVGGTVPSKANTWERRDGALVYVSDGSSGKLVPPVAINARSYEIEIQYERMSGPGCFHVDLPFEGSQLVPIYLDARGFRTITSGVGRSWPSSVAKRSCAVIRMDRGASGSNDRITVHVDGELWEDWKGDLRTLNPPKGEPHPDFPGQLMPSLFVRSDWYRFTAWTLRIFDGEAKVLREASAWIPLDISAGCNANVIRTEREKVTHAFGISGRSWATTGWRRAKGFDRDGLPDDGQIAIPNATPNGFFQLCVADGNDAILVSIRGQSVHAGRIPTNVTLNLPASQRQRYAQLAFLHACNPGDTEVSVTIRYDTGADGTGVLHPRNWNPDSRQRKEPLVGNETVAIKTSDGTAVPDAVEMLAETLPVDPQRELKSLTFTFRWLSPKCEDPLAAEKCLAGIFAISALPAAPVTRSPSLVTPDDDSFLKEVAALPAEEQVKRVVAELQRLNPGFDGKVTREIWGGWGGQLIVGRLAFNTQLVTNISPVRALRSLLFLGLDPAPNTTGVLTDLSPLKGLPLTELSCADCPIRDLSPLKGMPLKNLVLNNTPIEDLSPLSEMPLKVLRLSKTPVSDLSPLKGLKLTTLNISGTRVTNLGPLRGMPLEELLAGGSTVNDLTPLKGMPLRLLYVDFTGVGELSALRGLPLKELNCNLNPERDAEVLRAIKTLEKINGLPAAEVWKIVK